MMGIKTAISKKGDRVYTDGVRFVPFSGSRCSDINVALNFKYFASVSSELALMEGYDKITDWEDV